ncbi:hypothetical protein [Pseudochryseolinea flava]|uniref:Cytochrome C Planctomycete-type domain-containing protein n=1 Tax=Pseudochryseolinea flava TaxID=2059302 RepID=A0A364Y2U5_9BACT|nr:hypothetical protein [Pseudochryseolinea flava]RAW01233.1 hypothetical protein DQQ10_09990 [Pseudochryseolinea flava]
MKIRFSIFLFVITILFNVLYGCVSHDLAGPFVVECTEEVLRYEVDIVPIINANCAISGCHDGSNSLPDWTDHETLAGEGAEVQRRITLPLNDPAKMPRVGSITAEERQKLFCWIEQGALDN